MKNVEFCRLFSFFTVNIRRERYTDARSGCPTNYLAVMTGGSGRLVSASGTVEVKAGDMFFIPKGLSYQSYWGGETGAGWSAFAFDVIPDPENRLFDLQKIAYTDEEYALWNTLCALCGVSIRSVGVFYTLLGSLAERMHGKPARHGSVVLQTALRLMEQNPQSTVPDIAAACRISVSGLYAVFRRELGRTPVQHKHLVLSQKAAELLCNTDHSVETVSGMLGFSSSSYFRKVLYAVTGKTPSQIRKERFLM